MLQFLNPYYPWIKAFHVIAVIAWMAGMLYLPRLFFYHCEAISGSQDSERFKRMEKRLLRIILNPAMVVEWIFGLTMVFTPSSGDQNHVSLMSIVTMTL